MVFVEELTKDVSFRDFVTAADSLPKVVSFVDFVGAADSFPKVVSLTGLLCWTLLGLVPKEPWSLGSAFALEACSWLALALEACAWLALALEDCTWLACVLCGLAIELLAFIFPDGSSKKLFPLEAATMDLSIDVCLLMFLKIALIKIHLAFVISWLPWLLVGDSAFPGIENYIQGMALTRL